MKMLKEIKSSISSWWLTMFPLLSPSFYKIVREYHKDIKKQKAEDKYLRGILSQEFNTLEEIKQARKRINENKVNGFLLSIPRPPFIFGSNNEEVINGERYHMLDLVEEYLNNCEASLEGKQKDDEFEKIRIKLINSGLDLGQINKFLVLYSIIKRRFPDYSSIHEGFLSAIKIDILNPGFDYKLTDHGEIVNKVSKISYNFSKHINTLSKIIELESQTLPQRVLIFRQIYNPRDQGLSELEREGISISELEEKLQKQKNSGNKKDFRQHDLTLPTYLRLRSQKTIDSIIIGDTISTFLNLDPDLQTARCTAGNGIFRKTTYQYALYEDISVIDLCFNTPENKVAEVITVNCKNDKREKFLLVETAEAGDDAFLLPDYKGMPAWTYLLLEEVVDRARNSGSKLVFTTNLDFKPATNMFVTTAAKMLGFAKNIPDSEKYKPRFREEPLKYDEFLTTIRWKGHKEAQSIHLEKEVEGVIREMVYTPVSFGPLTVFAWILNYLSKDLFEYDFIDKLENRERIVQDTIKGTGLLPETYLGAWNSRLNFKPSMIAGMFDFFYLLNVINDESIDNEVITFIRNRLQKPKKPFYYRRHPNINNGKGFVDGFEYKVTEENYKIFKQKMQEIKSYLSLG